MPTAAVVSATEVNRQTTRPFSEKEQIKNPLATNRWWRARGEDLISFAPTFYSGTSSNITFAAFNRTRVKHNLQYLPRFCEHSFSPVCRPASMSHSPISITTLYPKKALLQTYKPSRSPNNHCAAYTLDPWITIYYNKNIIFRLYPVKYLYTRFLLFPTINSFSSPLKVSYIK